MQCLTPPERGPALLILSVVILLCACDRQRELSGAPAPIEQFEEPESVIPSPELEPVRPLLTWESLHQKLGGPLLEFTLEDFGWARYSVSDGDLVLYFKFPMTRNRGMLTPTKTIDYQSLSEALGAKKVFRTPSEFMMRCGTNEGGEFAVENLRFGVYISGGCIHFRIFDVDAHAIELFLGPDFQFGLDACEGQEVGPFCRTQAEIKVGVRRKPNSASAEADRFLGYRLNYRDGWLVGTAPDNLRGLDVRSVSLSHKGVTCRFNLPDPVDPSICELVGDPFVPVDVCTFDSSCELLGLCTLKDGVCVATVESCKASLVCESNGVCDLSQSGECVAPNKSEK